MTKKKKQSGNVDRIEESVVVVVIPDPKSPDNTVEIYIPKEDFQNPPKEGDYVTVEVDD